MNKQLTIVGGGITGLASAYIAARNGYKVRVLEASPHFGGLLNTFPIGGNRLEYFYHHFFTHDVELNWLIKELGIDNKLVYKKTTMGVFRDGTVYPFNSPSDLLHFSPLTLLDKGRFAATSLYLGKLARWEDYESISCLEWLYRYAGVNTTNSLWKPLLDIKFGPYANDVPLAWLIGRLRQRMNSRNRGEEKLGYLQGSLDTLLNALMEKLKCLSVELINHSVVTNLQVSEGKLVGLQTSKATYSGGDYLFTIPTNYAKELVKGIDSHLYQQLDKIEYFGAVCVILDLKKPLSQTYWLNVADSGSPFGGIIEHTNFIPSQDYNNKYIAYLSRYYSHQESISSQSNEEIIATMVPYVKKIYKTFNPENINDIHVFRTKTAATVCDLNFSRNVHSFKSSIQNMWIANMVHIYPDERSVNNAIRVSAEACRVMGMQTSFIPAGNSLSGKIGG
ncbi:NAD(P)/FAD-dependent oxidoreductase [Larkinella rosea]|uniref:NAD(P)/FAD-dependent oxidoreductase n=1 Tax=Larkinella rosea TaxID=2025312 RepID=A0A3P1C156_9BACT|nr:NAD(P)/FAD-dependent oxidoreductase [Larkinella rosea]RRB06866.1 NAD(P)/FAD-dependent oxidoreductase [Larkinella rosea]